MAPKQRKKTIPTNKTPQEDIPPPPPLKDDTSDYESSSDSESDISEVTPPPPPLPPPKPLAPPLKQQTLMSSYSGSYKATILKLLREDPQVQEVLAETILRITGNGGNPITPSDGDLHNRLLKLLQEDAELRDAILGILPKPRSRASKPKATKPDNQPQPQQPTHITQPDDNTNLPFEKRTLAFLRAHAHTALTYEEFSEQSEITDADLECILQKGFVEGFSTLILRNLANLELSQRPVLSFARDHSAVYVKIGPTRWKRDAPPQSNTNKRNIENETHTSEVAIGENKGCSNTKWEYLSEIVFVFSQKVDIKIAELRSDGLSDGWTQESWNDRLDRVRKQASGGIDRIRLISDICRQIANGAFVEV